MCSFHINMIANYASMSSVKMKETKIPMQTVSTVVLLDEAVIYQIERIAAEIGISLDDLYVRAIEELIQRHKNRAISEKIDAVLADVDQTEDLAFLNAALRHFYANYQD